MDQFTYEYYEELLKALIDNDYQFIFFNDFEEINEKDKKIILLRHDVDFDPFKAKNICKIEKKYNVQSTYFFMLNSKFYNIHNIEIYNILKEIIEEKNHVGIHFDEASYTYSNSDELTNFIKKEIGFFEELLNQKIKIISFHRPTDNVLLNKIKIPIFHTYQEIYAKKTKYLSDSKKMMKEGDFIDIINSGKYDKIQILIHPFWWNNKRTDPQSDYNEYVKMKTYELKKEISNNSKIYRFDGDCNDK